MAAVQRACLAGECDFYGSGRATGRRRGASFQLPVVHAHSSAYNCGEEPGVAATDEAACLQRAITQVLALDIRSVHRGRGSGAAHGPGDDPSAPPPSMQPYELYFDSLYVEFTVCSASAAREAGEAESAGTFCRVDSVTVASLSSREGTHAGDTARAIAPAVELEATD